VLDQNVGTEQAVRAGNVLQRLTQPAIDPPIPALAAADCRWQAAQRVGKIDNSRTFAAHRMALCPLETAV
jgi:hypothetical protein